MMMIRRNRGIKLGRKIIRIFNRFTRYPRNSCRYKKLGNSIAQGSSAMPKLFKWGGMIKRAFFNTSSRTGYVRVGHESMMDTRPVHVLKGHLAVYVGELDGDMRRVLLPISFLSHPMFEKLLKKAEDVYGFNYPGRITVPCPVSEFEFVKSRIAATRGRCRSTFLYDDIRRDYDYQHETNVESINVTNIKSRRDVELLS